jgi:hypothetical protein
VRSHMLNVSLPVAAMPCRVGGRQQNCGGWRSACGGLRRTVHRATYRAPMMSPALPDLALLTDSAGRPAASVSAAVEAARAAIAALRRHPANRTGWPRTAAAASVRAARASAALDGAPLVLELDTGVVADPVVAGALRAGAAIGSLTTVWPRAPLQALARLHTLAAADLVPADELGRPRPGGGSGFGAVADLVTSGGWPAPIQVALIHGQLLTMPAFRPVSGVVARAAARLAMISSGLDPMGLGVPEAAHLRAVTVYGALAEGFAGGDPEAVLAWVLEACRCLTVGAREGLSIADAAVEG